MPDVDSQLSKFADRRIFTTLDFSNGFLQIQPLKEAKEKTAFVTEETTVRSENMHFRLKGTFFRYLQGFRWSREGPYLPWQYRHTIQIWARNAWSPRTSVKGTCRSKPNLMSIAKQSIKNSWNNFWKWIKLKLIKKIGIFKLHWSRYDSYQKKKVLNNCARCWKIR